MNLYHTENSDEFLGGYTYNVDLSNLKVSVVQRANMCWISARYGAYSEELDYFNRTESLNRAAGFISGRLLHRISIYLDQLEADHETNSKPY